MSISLEVLRPESPRPVRAARPVGRIDAPVRPLQRLLLAEIAHHAVGVDGQDEPLAIDR